MNFSASRVIARNRRPTPRASYNGRAGLAVILLGGLIIIAASSFSYLVFLMLATVPVFAATFLERPGQRQATISVGALTMATVIPLILGAIANGSERDLLRSSTAWTFVAAAAIIGAGIYFLMPIAAVWLEDMQATGKLRKMRAQQDALIADWGPEVAKR